MQSVGMVGSTVLSVMYSIGWPSAPPPPLQVATLPFTLITGTAAMSASASLRWGFMYSTGLPPLVPRARTAVWVRARAAASFGAWPRQARHQTPDQRPTAFGRDAISFFCAGELSRRGAGGGARRCRARALP